MSSQPKRPMFLPLPRGVLREYASPLAWVQQGADILISLACFYGMVWLRLDGETPPLYDALALVIALLMAILYQSLGVYHNLRTVSLWLELRGLVKAWLVVLLFLFAIGFATKTGQFYSRQVMLGWAVLALVTQVIFHAAVRKLLRRLRAQGYNLRKALLVGELGAARQFTERIARQAWLGIAPVGFVGPRPAEEAAAAESDGGRAPVLSWLGPVEQLTGLIKEHHADVVYVVLPLSRSHEIEELNRVLLPLHVAIHWVPDISTFHLVNHSIREIEGQPIICISDSPITGLPWLGKWLEDKVIALTILVLASPLLALIALAVKLTSPGPVLFKQKRAGLNSEHITMYKFRTMRVHSEPEGQVTQATQDDPRLTPIGRFLRASSLDELPQFYNVLQGRMSVVGPRPHALEHDDYYEQQIEAYMLRHRIRPGITGWAQVNGYRGGTDQVEHMAQRVKYDIDYINNCSVSFDLLIILMTVWAVLSGKNAY